MGRPPVHWARHDTPRAVSCFSAGHTILRSELNHLFDQLRLFRIHVFSVAKKARIHKPRDHELQHTSATSIKTCNHGFKQTELGRNGYGNLIIMTSKSRKPDSETKHSKATNSENLREKPPRFPVRKHAFPLSHMDPPPNRTKIDLTRNKYPAPQK